MYYQVDAIGDGETAEDNNVPDAWTEVTNKLSVYRFKPSLRNRELRLRRDHDFKAELRIAINRACILIVTQVYDEKWWFIKWGHFTGWVYITRDMEAAKVLTRVESFRRYEAWHGNNTFLCQGKLIVGSDNLTFG